MKQENIRYYEGAYADEFPMGPYFRDKLGVIPSTIRYDYPFDYQKILKYFTESLYLELITQYELTSDKNSGGITQNIFSKTKSKVYNKS